MESRAGVGRESPSGGIPFCCSDQQPEVWWIMSFEANCELVPVGGGDSIPLIRDILTIGRRDSCDIPLRLPNVSGMHAELSFREGYWYIKDLNSTNGVKINGVRHQQKLLLPGDQITIA